MNRPDIIIREASNDDCERVIKLVSSVLDEFHLPFEPDSKDADLADIERMYIQAGGWFEVIEDQSGRLLGTYGLFPLNDITCELRKMYFYAKFAALVWAAKYWSAQSVRRAGLALRQWCWRRSVFSSARFSFTENSDSSRLRWTTGTRESISASCLNSRSARIFACSSPASLPVKCGPDAATAGRDVGAPPEDYFVGLAR